MCIKRKVFISVLGTGGYKECTYKKGDFECKTKFIQEATLRLLQREEPWGKDSAVYVLLTDGARGKNWEVCKDREGKVIDERGLKKVLESMGLKSHIEDVTIKEGRDEDELWDIFNTVYGLLQEGDELHFDLTHGFRYLPMLVLVLGNYAKFLKGVTVKSITYGNYEMRDDKDVAPIIDLLPLSSLQDWTFAAADFTENGNAGELSALCEKLTRDFARQHTLLNEVEERDQVTGFKRLIATAKKFTDEMKFCRGLCTLQATEYARMMECSRSGIQETVGHIHPIFNAITPIINAVVNSAQDFSETRNVRNCFAAAKWCYEKGQFQSAATELEEGVISFFCLRHGIDVSNEKERGIVNSAIAKRTWRDHLCKSDYRENGEVDEGNVDEVANDELLSDKRILNAYNNLVQLRNDYNHAGMRSIHKPLTADNMKEKLKSHINTLTQLLFGQAQMPEADNPRLLVNLSSHPSRDWDQSQLEAAKQYGEVMDMGFPQVNPLCSEDDIDGMAEKVVSEILQLAETHIVTVHVMGEMNLTFDIVSKLRSHGVTCIASTTERITEYLPDGSKRSEFHFKIFRKYA